jgi:hypothetical protein
VTDFVLVRMGSVFNAYGLEALVNLVEAEFDVVHLDFPNWLQLQNLLEVGVVLVELSPYILQEELIKVLDTYKFIAFDDVSFLLLDLGKDVQVPSILNCRLHGHQVAILGGVEK